MSTEAQQTRKIQIKIADLLAARLFASGDKSRYILNSVRIEAGHESAVLVATSGTTLATVQVVFQERNQTPFSVTVPADAVDSVAKQCAKDAEIELAVEFDMANAQDVVVLKVGMGRDSVVVRAGVLPGDYPNWRMVLPRFEPVAQETVTLSAVLAERFIKAAKILKSDGGLCLGMSAEGGPVQVTISGRPQFFGLWMPMNAANANGRVPEWLSRAVAELQPAENLPGMELEPDAPQWGDQKSIELWKDKGITSTIGVNSCTTNGKVEWVAYLLLYVGEDKLTENDERELPRCRERIDAIRRAAKRAKAWLKATVGKESAQGFHDAIDKAVAAHKEREE